MSRGRPRKDSAPSSDDFKKLQEELNRMKQIQSFDEGQQSAEQIIQESVEQILQDTQVAPRKGRGRPKKDALNTSKNQTSGQLKNTSHNSENKTNDAENIKKSKNRLSTIDDPTELEEEAKLVDRLTPTKKAMQDFYDKVLEESSTKFGISVVDHKKYQCSMCGHQRKMNDYFRSYSLIDMGNMLPTGEQRMTICKRCVGRIFNYYMEKYKNHYSAINRTCQTCNIYFSIDVYNTFVKTHNGRIGTVFESKYDVMTDYMTVLGQRHLFGYTYWDSPLIQDNPAIGIQIVDEILDESPFSENYPDEFQNWKKDDLDNYDYVVQVYKYDPFIDEPIDDRKKLYYNLAGFSDENIAEDVGKANACIDMCRSLQRLENLNKLRIRLEQSDEANVKDIRQISELQEKERKSIQQYQKEWGFNRRYALNRSQGAGTLTGILKDMDDSLFENSLPNAYDIKTSAAIQAAADASWKAIFSQLNLSDSEFAEMVKRQRETITDLRSKLDQTKEELRKTKLELKRIELVNELEEQRRSVIVSG